MSMDKKSSGRLKKFITRKSGGSFHILIESVFIMILMVVLMLYTWTMYKITLLDQSVDDSLTSAVLAAITPNIQEVGTTKQVVMADTLKANETAESIDSSISAMNLNIDKKFMISDGGNIAWQYPTYTMMGTDDNQATLNTEINNHRHSDYPEDSDVQGALLRRENITGTWKFRGYAGVKGATSPTEFEIDPDMQNSNALLLSSLTPIKGEYLYEWVNPQDIDNAYRDILNNSITNNGITSPSKGNAKEFIDKTSGVVLDSGLKKVAKDFVECFSVNVNARKVDKDAELGMVYIPNRFGDILRTENYKVDGNRYIIDGMIENPFIVDNVRVFNSYKHYITDTDNRIVYYPARDRGRDLIDTGDDVIYIKIGNVNYGLNEHSAYRQKMLDLVIALEGEGLAGAPMYDKYMIKEFNYTKQKIKSQGATNPLDIYASTGKWTAVAGDSNNNRDRVIGCAYLDMTGFTFNEANKTFDLDSPNISAIDSEGNAVQWRLDFNDSLGNSHKTVMGLCNSPSEINKLVYSLSYNANNMSDAIKNHPASMVIRNSAVCAQVSFRLQMIKSHIMWWNTPVPPKSTDPIALDMGLGINNARYCRIVDATVHG